ncbi:unnamed protein product [Miscanthus lutarioriparius]|uniref:Uncharacterized protein n=1 Tax=Miscanthus lutarioriparius TaxID=422564 RepID=A0A811Q1F2_9POAL|nr:unnamed protein product [Miscanthus lutarioriparius]
MAPTPPHLVTVLEQFHVAPTPAPAAGQPRALPLTFFDLVFWSIPPVQRLFFYDNANLLDVSDFTLGELPRFRNSLAAALHHFYPLAGKLTCEVAEGVAPPELVFSDGDSVPLTVAQGILAVQITVFPRAGICIGTTVHHAVADGASYTHFLSTWAAAHRLGHKGNRAVAMDMPPLFDRGVVRDDAGLREAFLRDHRALGTAGGYEPLDDWDLSRRPGVVLATFRFTEKQLRALERHAESETSTRCSPNALACGAAWAGIVHARGNGWGLEGAPAPDAHFGFVTGPKLGMYAGTDFGGVWGRPTKVEIAYVERTGALALAESCRDGHGDIEVGLALPRVEMEAFRTFYLDGSTC